MAAIDPGFDAALDLVLERNTVLEEAEPFFSMFPLDPKPSRTPPAVAGHRE